jgi:hypothetical protein
VFFLPVDTTRGVENSKAYLERCANDLKGKVGTAST